MLSLPYVYWVAPGSALWDSSNWSATSGGPPTASIPGSADIAVFDGSSLGTCFIDSHISVAGLQLRSDFSKGLFQNSYSLQIGGYDASFAGGSFIGSTNDIMIEGSFSLTGTIFKSTSGTLSVRDNFYCINKSSGSPATILTAEISISALDIANKFVYVSNMDTDQVAVNIVGGDSLYEGEDFYLDESLIRWDGLDYSKLLGLAVGDILRVVYPAIPGLFFHNYGKVLIKNTNKRFFGGGIELYDLEFVNNFVPQATYIDSSSYVDHALYLTSGCLIQGMDGTINLYGDATCSSSFGAFSGNDAVINMIGDRHQSLHWDVGGIFPSIYVTKPNPDYTTGDPLEEIDEQVFAVGHSGDLRVAGDFVVNQGIFNTNGFDIRIGNV